VFRALDGYVALTCRNDAEWGELVAALPSAAGLGSPDLGTLAGRIRQRDHVRRELGEIIGHQPAAAWEQAFGRRGIPCVRVLHDDEVLARKEYWEAGLLRELPLPHAAALVAGGPPWWLGSADAASPPAPAPGADTEALRANPEAFWLPRPSR